MTVEEKQEERGDHMTKVPTNNQTVNVVAVQYAGEMFM